MAMSKTLALTEALIARPSVTPDDAGCLDLLQQHLNAQGFASERIDSGPDSKRVSNLWSIHASHAADAPTLVLAGHTDVVPTGPIEQWTSDPFTPSQRDGRLYGRGASDMKTSIAAMVVAVQEFLQQVPKPAFSIGFLLTSDEEGPAIDGTTVVCQALKKRGQRLDWCIVGEPTSVQRTGDMIKNGRRGTLSGKLRVKGIQGHIAYPHLARNPIHDLAAVLAEWVATRWDQGNEYFPPTSWQVSNIHAGTGAGNVIPGDCVLDFNFRFCTESTPDGLKARITDALDRHGIQYEIDWVLGGMPFLTPRGDLVDVVQGAILDMQGIQTELSTTGGTSDGRFIAQICPQVIELGPPNASIHQINESVALSDVEALKNIYRRIFERLQDRLLHQ